MATADPQFPTLRDSAEKLLVRWLKKPYGYCLKLFYAMTVHFDLVGDNAIFGVRRRFPGYDYYDSTNMTGKDRKISRGRNETDAVFAARQLRWLDDHAIRGGPYALLKQIYEHYAAAPLSVNLGDGSIATIINKNGQRYRMDPAGEIERDRVVWTPDTEPLQWAHWWLGLQVGTVPDDGIWSDPGTWDDGGVWDYGYTSAEVADIRLIPQTWGNGHSIGHIALLADTDDLASHTPGDSIAIISVF